MKPSETTHLRWRVRRSGDSLGSMTPMIDVVFLLLIFFVWTNSFQPEELLLPSGLASTPGTTPAVQELDMPAELEPIVVRLELPQEADSDTSIQWQVNGRAVPDLDELGSMLRSLVEIKPDLPVVIDAAANVTLRHVVDAYDEARLVGFSRILFAAR